MASTISPTVLVTGAGHTAALSLMQALKDERLTLLACDDNPRAAGLRMLPASQRFVVHSSESPEFVGDLLALCLRRRVDVLVATDIDDVPAIARSRELFERLGTRVWLDPARRAARPGHEVTARQVVQNVCEVSPVQRAWSTLAGSANRLWRSMSAGT